VKPPPFDYAAPTSVAGAVQLLHEAAGAAKVLAGGQSLLQDLRWRRLAPALLVDIGGVEELAGITVRDGPDGAEVRIGARVRHRDLEDPGAVPGPLGALLARAAAHIAHPPVRTRGTVVGSLAWAHPAAEWCALAAGLRGRVELASATGRRELPVAELLLGPGRTACARDELITALVLPLLPAGTRVGFTEQRRTHASFAQVAVGVAVRFAGGRVAGADVALAGAGPTGLRSAAAEAVLLDTPAAPADLARAATAAASDCNPPDEPHAGARYRRHLVEVLVRRTLEEAS
jgi:aerobic carbon-monoxide dehydrogenase medium subunit